MNWIAQIWPLLSSGFYFVSKKPFDSQTFRVKKNKRMDLMLLDRKYREYPYDVAQVICNASVYFRSNRDMTVCARL